jgi:hypothetical protein
VHETGISPFDEIGLIAITPEQLLQLFMADARKDGGASNFVAVKVQNRQHRPILGRIEKLV